MASTSRALTLKLLADVDSFTKNLGKADNEVKGFGSKVADFGKKAGLAFAAAGAAATVYAGKLAIEGVQAAIADAAAQERLALTLKNVTGATEAQIAATEDYITKTSLAFGVTDDDLRPSLERLSRATGDLQKAQELQSVAIDIAAGSGKSLEAVTNAMARAAEGNTASLGRLGIGLSKAELASMSFEQITAKLAETFEGQATAKANTFQGQMERLKIAFDETKETVGTFILQAITPIVENIVNKIMPALSMFISGIGGKDGLRGAFQTYVDAAKAIFIPIFEGIKSAFDNIKDAVMDNKEEFVVLFNFLKNFVAPFFGTVFKKAIEVIGVAISGLIRLVASLISGFENAIGLAKTVSGFVGGIFGGNDNNNSSQPSAPTARSVPATIPRVTQSPSPMNITVNGAIDPEGTARTIVNVLNNSQARGTLGAAGLVGR